MGLGDAFFWSLTLSAFLRLWERHRARERQQDRRAGEIAAVIASAHRDPDKRRDPFTWLDFFPEWREAHPAQTDEEMLAAMEMWVAATAEKA